MKYRGIDGMCRRIPRKFAGFARSPRQNAYFMSLSFKLFLNSSADEAGSSGDAVNHSF